MYKCRNCLYWMRHSSIKRIHGKSGYCQLIACLKNAMEEVCHKFIYFKKEEAHEKFIYIIDPGDGFSVKKGK